MATMQNDKSEPSGSSTADCPGASDTEKRLQTASRAEAPKPTGISAVAVLWTFGKCLGALLPVYLAGYYRVSTSLLVCGMMVYTGWKHAREAKEARLKSAIQFEDSEDECASRHMSRIKRELPAWVSNDPTTATPVHRQKDTRTFLNPTLTQSDPLPPTEPVNPKVTHESKEPQAPLFYLRFSL